MSNEMLISVANGATDYRNLSEVEKRMFIQVFINSIHYDSERFRAAVEDLKQWQEKESFNQNKTESNG